MGMKAFILAMSIALAASGVSAQSINSGEPAEVAKALTTMGYQPEAIQPNDGSPMFAVTINDWSTLFLFSGCEAGKKCKYLVLLSGFTDIKDPPKEWVNRVNRELDLGKLWVNENRSTSFSLPVPAAGELLSISQLRFLLDQWASLITYLSHSAISEKLDK